METQTHHRIIVYKQNCPDCEHGQITRTDTILRIWDPAHTSYGLNSEIIDRPPAKPAIIGQPQEFWTNVHCDKCKRKFHHSIIDHDTSKILSDSEYEFYLGCLKNYELREAHRRSRT